MKTEKTGLAQGSFSLLHPQGADQASGGPSEFLALSPGAMHDLGLDEIIAAFTPEPEHQKEIRALFARLPRDPRVIAYRQAVLDDLLANPDLAERLAALLPVLDSFFEYSYRSEQEMSWLHEVVWRAGELQNVIDCLEGVGQILQTVESGLRSDGLRSLADEIRKAQDDPKYQSLVRELPVLLARLQGVRSMTIGVNLDTSLRPIQAALLEVNEQPFSDQTLLNRLFGVRGDRDGIAPLHSAPRRMVEGHYAFPISSDLGWAVDPMLIPLFSDLAKILEKAAVPVADKLNQYIRLHGQFLQDLRQGLVFYLGAIRWIRRFQTVGLPMCRPQIAAAEERTCEVRESYNVHLVLRTPQGEKGTAPAIVRNDIRIGPAGHILILTGPNHGGKTTYMQGAGVVHILAQAGCYVPGEQAIISPLDQLLTHFPIEEKPDADTGRLGEEAMRLGKIFEHVTRHSLVLLNETLSSTSFSESLYLAEDIVRILRQVGARGIYATHLHELAKDVDALNDSVPGESRIISVVSSPIDSGSEAIRNYRLEVRPPLGQSYAREIAAHYGISYQQLKDVLQKRGVL